MTRDDILTLAKAGFNAQQIAALASVQAQPVAAPVATPAPAPAPVQEQPKEQEKPLFDFNALLTRLDGMQSAMQRGAIATSAQPETPAMTADSILAEIINPPTLNKEG